MEKLRMTTGIYFRFMGAKLVFPQAHSFPPPRRGKQRVNFGHSQAQQAFKHRREKFPLKEISLSLRNICV
jgi:hypothetical protein